MRFFTYALATFFTVVLFSGCATTAPSDFKLFQATKNEYIKNDNAKSYIIGHRASCYVGDKMIDVFNYKKHVKETIDSNNQQYEALLDFKNLKKGQLYPLSGTSRSNDKNLYVFIFNDNGWYRYLKINDEGYIASNDLFDSSGFIVEKDYIRGEQKKMFNKINLKASSDIEERYLAGSFQYVLLYNGRSGDDIKIQYREFKDDMARIAFYQDLSYNIKESKFIRFKNFKIEIINATNEKIEYIILTE